MSTTTAAEEAFEREYQENFGTAWDSNKSKLWDLWLAAWQARGEAAAVEGKRIRALDGENG